MLKFRALGTFFCLGRKTNVTISVCLSIVQPLWCCLNAVWSPWGWDVYPVLFLLLLYLIIVLLLFVERCWPVPQYFLFLEEEEPYGASGLAGCLSGPEKDWVRRKERKERASMAEVQYCGLKWLMAYGKSCCFSPPLSGRPDLLCFCSLCAFELIDYIRTDKQQDLPDWKTDRSPVRGFRI